MQRKSPLSVISQGTLFTTKVTFNPPDTASFRVLYRVQSVKSSDEC